MKPQYLERAVTEDLHEHVLVLHALWKTGIVTDAYTEARLDELADLCSRKASLQRNYCRVAVPVREWDREPEDLHFGHFGTQLVRLMSDKGISRAELAKNGPVFLWEGSGSSREAE